MAVAVYDGYSEWVGTPGSTKAWSFPGTPTAGDTIYVWTYQSTENNGPIGASSASGYTQEFHRSSPLDWRGSITLLSKVAVGNETGVTVTWGLLNNYGCVVNSAFVSGSDPASLVVSGSDWSGTATFAADQLDFTVQCLGINSPAASTGAFPGGSTLISADWNDGFYRGSGWAVSGGSLTASPTASTGSLMTFSLSTGDPTYTAVAASHNYTTVGVTPTVTIITPIEGAQIQLPTTPTDSLSYSLATDNADTVEYRVSQLDAAWTDMTNVLDVNGDATGYFQFLADSLVAGDYTLEIRGTGGGQSVVDLHNFTVLPIIPPTAQPESASTDMNTAVIIDVLANDTNVDPAAVLTIESQATNGVATVNP